MLVQYIFGYTPVLKPSRSQGATFLTDEDAPLVYVWPFARLWAMLRELCPNGVEECTLESVCKTLKKSTLKKEDLKPAGYPVINSGRTLYGFYHNYNNEGPAFTVAARGEYAAFINFFEGKFWAGGLCYPYKSKNEKRVLTKFLYYSLKNKQQKIRSEIVAEGSIPALNKSDLEKVILPIPPLPVQEYIVSVLDRVDALCNDLSSGLPAEIEARTKQYEYYRDKLLAFKSPVLR